MPDNLYFDGGSFIPTNYVWDVAQVYSTDVTSPEFKELLVRMYQNVNNMILALNLKDTGIYNTSPFINSQVFFPNPSLNSSTSQLPEFRQVYRTVINFGALPNAAIKSVPHTIICTSNTTFTRIYGTASKTTAPFSYIPIPYSSVTAVADNIELYVDAANVNIATASDYSAYTTTYVILEYLQD
jgi:hypothetical protein